VKPTSLRTKLLSTMGITDLAPEGVLALPESSYDMPEPATDQTSAASEEPHAPDPETAVITRTRDSAIAFGKELIHALSADLRQGELSQLETVWEQFRYQVSVVNVANVALQRSAAVFVPSPQHDPAVARYFISSRFLTECHNFLIADPNGWERLHLVTGLQLDGNRYTLEQMQKVAMSAQSAGGATADQRALTQALIALTESGHALHGLFHSHPRQGPGATHPSDIDLPTHKRLEDGGYPVIGAIFVPGFVRFFSAERPFTLTIYGTGVTPVPGEKHVYHIQTSPRRVSYETIAGS
jgi:hypothetical protein